MKKLFALLMCVGLVLAFFGGCGKEKEHTLQVGFGKVNVTPDYGVPMSGNATGDSRISDKAVDELYVTCIALTDETGKTILMYVQDILFCDAMSLRKVIETTGVPYENIMLAATHNHNAPGLSYSSHASIEKYQKTFDQAMVDAAVAAMEDRKPAKMYITTTYPENVNFVRHYILKDGTKVGQSHATATTAASHLYKADNALQLIKFTREGGKDVVLMNWQAHVSGGTEHNNHIISFQDVIAKELEKTMDCHFALFFGASGDVGFGSKVREIQKAEWYLKSYDARAKRLAECTVQAAESFREVKIGPLQILRHKEGVFQQGGDTQAFLNLAVYSIGEVAFAAVPYEMFGPNGSAVKDGSPFEMTFVSTCTNGAGSYIPADYAFDYTIPCYEMSHNVYRRGTAEQLADAFVSMLKQVHGTRFGENQ